MKPIEFYNITPEMFPIRAYHVANGERKPVTLTGKMSSTNYLFTGEKKGEYYKYAEIELIDLEMLEI